LDQGRVRFRWRDLKDHNQMKEMSLDAIEFIRRFLLLVLPCGVILGSYRTATAGRG
jgi:hypothetical protein